MVTANTFRKVQRDSGVGGESERVKLTLTIQVEGVEYDAEGGRRILFFLLFHILVMVRASV